MPNLAFVFRRGGGPCLDRMEEILSPPRALSEHLEGYPKGCRFPPRTRSYNDFFLAACHHPEHDLQTILQGNRHDLLTIPYSCKVYLEGQGDLVSRLITPVTRIVTPFIPRC